jgi:hypothetical protein
MLDVGVELDDLRPLARQEMGSVAYAGHDRDGLPVRVRVLGRDAQDTQWFARRWRLLAYRDPPRSAPVGRLEQVEHEALATLMATQAGVRVPEVVIAARGQGGYAGLVVRQADIDPLELASADQIRDQTLVELWRQVATLHAAGISHGRLNASRVILDHDGQPVIVGFAAATLGAPEPALDIDVAELLVSTTVLVGPEPCLERSGPRRRRHRRSGLAALPSARCPHAPHTRARQVPRG